MEDADEFTSKILVETVEDGQYLDLNVNKTILKFTVGDTIDVEDDCVYNIELQNQTVMKISKQTAALDQGNSSSVEESTSSLEGSTLLDKGSGSSVEESTSSLEESTLLDKGSG